MNFKYLMTLTQVLFFSCFVIFGGSAWAKNDNDLCKGKVVSAEVVAIEQAIVLNRYGAFNPAGMLYALQRDVVFSNHPSIPDGTFVTAKNLHEAPGFVKLRDGKRPRPLVLRVNEGDCLEVTFHNLLMPGVPDERHNLPEQYHGKVPAHLEDTNGIVYSDTNLGRNLVRASAVSSDLPYTRATAFHVNGLNVVPVPQKLCPLSTTHPKREWLCGTEGGNVGLNRATVNPKTPEPLRRRLEQQGGLIYPGQSAIYRMFAFREGTYFAYSTGATVGGEGNGGQLGVGLFGAVNVQPRGSKWYRSQVTHEDLRAAARPVGAGEHPYANLDYDGARYTSGPFAGTPILAMLDDNKKIVHSDLNAVIVLTGQDRDHNDTTGPDKKCEDYAPGNSCGLSYREFTVIMHDEVEAVQAFAELEDEANPLHYIKDGMGINYGVGGMGAMVVARNRRVGPVRNCLECRAEEFFLSSWANGDPALILRWDDDGKRPVGAMYPDDPSNVHHSYLNDPVRFRNIHAGPKETHVFHLHAHQWMHDTSNPGSTYLDSQTISPGATFSYEIAFGGSGNRNHAPGDSIFHCHLYPHFAQGMWELWRVHDVFEDGSEKRKLPDAEVAGGTENPAIVPIPGSVMALMPTDDFLGYPFYIAGEAGHRPPQPPMDMDRIDGEWVDGGLQRHVLTGGWGETGNNLKPALGNADVIESALSKGSLTAQINARRVYSKNPNALTALAEEWEEITENGIKLLKPLGEQTETNAMAFHEGMMEKPGFIKKEVPAGSPLLPRWAQPNKNSKGYLSHWAKSVAGQTPHPEVEPVFLVNGRKRVAGAPFSDPCPVHDEQLPQREYKVGVIQTELTVNRHGWFDPQARILVLEQDIKDIINPNTRDRLPEPLFFRANSGDCINFKHSNFVPNALALDDFQIYTPTDTIGQHIHLVKFDVTSSDGSGNGWNYEDGTFSPEEVRERVFAYNRAIGTSGRRPLKLKTHPLFEAPCAAGDKNCEALKVKGTCPPNADSMSLKQLAEKHPFCGAQRTVQRWYADPILDSKNGRDYTLRTVFTHDHFGPSSHQQHGLYAALVIEPSNSIWLNLDANSLDWSKLCGTDEHDREAERKKVMGGANLSNYDVEGLCSQDKRAYTEVVGAKELRAPLKIREDGGPTATRANIVSPLCLSGETNGGSRKNSNPLDPQNDPQYQVKIEGEEEENPLSCPENLRTKDTRREYALAFADFAILYNTALEPINPEQRDVSALRFGRRQVAINNPMPLGISSEDPGTQLINYRNEPIPLRVTDLTVDPVLGGFNAQQKSCKKGDLSCTGDMANVFSTEAHKTRDRKLATQSYSEFVSFNESVRLGSNKLFLPEATRQLLEGTPVAGKLDQALDEVEAWRRDFNCALYSEDQLSEGCRPGLQRLEPWREIGDPATPILAAYEGDPLYVRLIQGAQEAQHVFAMTGNKWLKEPDNPNSGYTNAQPLGISEHFEFDIDIGPADGSAPRVDMMYYGSSMDQLWDGMWGLVRSYGSQLVLGDNKNMLMGVNAPGVKQLNFPGAPVSIPAYEKMLGKSTNICLAATEKVFFDISAVHACDLTQTCGEAKQEGVTYNQRLGIDDPHAIVFVRNNRLPNAEEAKGFNLKFNNEILSDLQQDVKANRRRIEPLVLRAPAGACMEVQVRNHLREPLFDSEIVDGKVVNGPIIDSLPSTEHFSDNFMSMILDGFNYNQLRMSSSIGLAAPMVARFSLSADGANFGINSIQRPDFPQANLVRTCAPGETDNKCKLGGMRWYAGNYAVNSSGTQLPQPIEFGALPLSSFGDVIKHSAHGLIGALVIGPEGSKVCTSRDADERNADHGTDTSATICDEKGKRLYRDFVLVLQDAVDAKINGDQVANLKGAEEPDDYGIKAVNYRTEPLWGRRGLEPSVEFEERNEFDYANVLSSKMVHNNASSLPLSREDEHKFLKLGKKLDFAKASKMIRCQAGIKLLLPPFADRYVCDPETPLFVARAGSEVRLRIVHPGGHTRQQAFTLHGHDWDPAPWKVGSQQLNANHAESMKESWIVQGSYNGIGPMMATNLLVHAGGRSEEPMDYLWRSQASFIFDGGIWGLLRVLPHTSESSARHKR